jgi:hypothetical protein
MERLDASSERLHVAVSKLTEIAGKKNPAYNDVLKSVRQIRVECSDIRDQWQQHHQQAHHNPEGQF